MLFFKYFDTWAESQSTLCRNLWDLCTKHLWNVRFFPKYFDTFSMIAIYWFVVTCEICARNICKHTVFSKIFWYFWYNRNLLIYRNLWDLCTKHLSNTVFPPKYFDTLSIIAIYCFVLSFVICARNICRSNKHFFPKYFDTYRRIAIYCFVVTCVICA